MASAELQQVRTMYAELIRVIAEHLNEGRMGEIRALMDESSPPAPEGTRVTPVDAGGVPAEWVRAPGADPGMRLLYFHGGGYVLGSLDTHRELSARLSAASGCSVLAAHYRLGPEHPFPAAVEDGLAALRWLRGHGPEGATPASSLFLDGDSAGGGLVLATLISARDAGDPLPNAAVTVSAWTDLAGTGASMQTRRKVDPGGPYPHLDTMARLYLQGADARTPLASPLYADLRGLPPLLMLAGDAEMLLDDTTRVAEKARAAGVEVMLEVWPEMPHIWHHFAGVLPEGQKAIDRIGQFLRAHAGAKAR